MRTFRIWSEGDCFSYSGYGSDEICFLSQHNGLPQIFLHFKAIGQTNQSLDSSIPTSSTPSIATFLTAIIDEIDRNICSLEDSMDFLCSEEMIELGMNYSVINLCSRMVFFFFFYQIKQRLGDTRKAPSPLSLSLFLSLCAQYFNRLIFYLFIERLLNGIVVLPNNIIYRFFNLYTCQNFRQEKRLSKILTRLS